MRSTRLATETSILHDNGWVDETYEPSYVSGTRKIDYTLYNVGINYQVDYGYDGRGNRTYGDDTRYTTDRRDYSYDARNNLITVTGTTVDDLDWSTRGLHND